MYITPIVPVEVIQIEKNLAEECLQLKSRKYRPGLFLYECYLKGRVDSNNAWELLTIILVADYAIVKMEVAPGFGGIIPNKSEFKPYNGSRVDEFVEDIRQ